MKEVKKLPTRAIQVRRISTPKIYHLGMKTNIMTIETGNVFPRRTNTAIRFGIFIGVLLVLSLVTYSFIKGWIDDQLDPPGEPGIAITVEIPQGGVCR